MFKRTLALILMFGLVVGCAEATPTAATEPNPDPLETIPFPPPVQQSKEKDGFSTTDRLQSERYMAQLQKRYLEIPTIKNGVTRQEKYDELMVSVKELDGKFVTWESPTQLSQDGKSLVVNVVPKGKRYSVFQLGTSNYGEFQLPHLTAVRLQHGRELDTAAFRKLNGGESVKFKALVEVDAGQFGLAFNLVGRIVEDPFGRPLKYEAFQARSTWAGQCVAGRNKSSLKIVVTERTKDTFKGSCTDMRSLFGNNAYAVTGKLDGDKVEMTIHRGNSPEPFPYFTTFKGTLTDGFVMKGTFDKGTCLFSLME